MGYKKAILKSDPKTDTRKITQKVVGTLVTGTKGVVVDTLSVVADEADLERAPPTDRSHLFENARLQINVKEIIEEETDGL